MSDNPKPLSDLRVDKIWDWYKDWANPDDIKDPPINEETFKKI